MTLEKTVKIPNLEHYENLIKKIKSELDNSSNDCDNLLNDLKSNEHINYNERSNYMDFEELDYLLTDLRSGRSFGEDFSPLSKMITELKEFKQNLDSYDSDIYQENEDKKYQTKKEYNCSMCDKKTHLVLDSNCCKSCLDSSF